MEVKQKMGCLLFFITLYNFYFNLVTLGKEDILFPLPATTYSVLLPILTDITRNISVVGLWGPYSYCIENLANSG